VNRNVRVRGGIIALSDERGPPAPRAECRLSALRAGRRLPAPHAGRCLVLLHGFTGNKASWADVRAALRLSMRVIAVDLPGHGGTRMDGRVFDYSLERTADAVVAALDAIGVSRFALAGYSMGGRVALQIALAHGARVERLALESASAGLTTAAARARRRRADATLAASIETAGIADFVRRWEELPLFRSLAAAPARTRHALRRQRLCCAPAGLAASLRGMGTGVQPWLGDRLGALAMPVVLITGALDRGFTRIARQLARRLSQARVEVIEGAGHMPHVERPARFLRLIEEFLGVPMARRAGARHRTREETHAD